MRCLLIINEWVATADGICISLSAGFPQLCAAALQVEQPPSSSGLPLPPMDQHRCEGSSCSSPPLEGPGVAQHSKNRLDHSRRLFLFVFNFFYYIYSFAIASCDHPFSFLIFVRLLCVSMKYYLLLDLIFQV